MLKHVFVVVLIGIPSETKCLKLMFTCTTKVVYCGLIELCGWGNPLIRWFTETTYIHMQINNGLKKQAQLDTV